MCKDNFKKEYAMEYELISSREFRDNLKKYLDLADQGKTIYVKRHHGRYYRLGVPSKLPDFANKPILCEHDKLRGECMVVWCQHNPNNINHLQHL